MKTSLSTKKHGFGFFQENLSALKWRSMSEIRGTFENSWKGKQIDLQNVGQIILGFYYLNAEVKESNRLYGSVSSA